MIGTFELFKIGIAAMRETGRGMQSKYKETSLGGLAVNLAEKVSTAVL